MSNQTILVGVDGSPAAQRALEWAAHQAHDGDEVVVVHVLTYSREFWRDLPPTGLTAWRDKLRDTLEREWMAPLDASGTKHEAILVEDDSIDAALLRVADERHAAAIVLGKHGHGALTDRLLGSVTYKVAHRSSLPVVIIPADWSPASP